MAFSRECYKIYFTYLSGSAVAQWSSACLLKMYFILRKEMYIVFVRFHSLHPRLSVKTFWDGSSWVKSIHWNAFRTRSHITRCSIERWYNMVPAFSPLNLTFFPEMAGETECQTSETVNSLKRKIALPSLLLYTFRCIDYT